MIIQIIYKQRVIRVLTALDMTKLTKIAYLFTFKNKIDFENLLVLEKTALPSN